jgi:hypothetical protein
MKKVPMLWLLAALVTTSGSISAAVRPAAAAEPMTTMDCTQAESMLDSAVSSKASTIMTGDVDKDFATLMVLHEKVGKRIDQIEAKCGKDAKMQAMAAKGSDGAQARMDEFRNLGTSQ